MESSEVVVALILSMLGILYTIWQSVVSNSKQSSESTRELRSKQLELETGITAQTKDLQETINASTRVTISHLKDVETQLKVMEVQLQAVAETCWKVHDKVVNKE